MFLIEEEVDGDGLKVTFTALIRMYFHLTHIILLGEHFVKIS
jgi:hypothetical protein